MLTHFEQGARLFVQQWSLLVVRRVLLGVAEKLGDLELVCQCSHASLLLFRVCLCLTGLHRRSSCGVYVRSKNGSHGARRAFEPASPVGRFSVVLSSLFPQEKAGLGLTLDSERPGSGVRCCIDW